MSEQYLKNVQAMCDRLGLPNPINEDDLQIKSISFYTATRVNWIEGTDMNRAGRLFFQEQMGVSRSSGPIAITESLRASAASFFAENWHDAQEKGRKMLIAFHGASRFRIDWK